MADGPEAWSRVRPSGRSGVDRVAAAVAAVRSVEREVRGIVVWRGRLPRDPAWAPAVAPVPATAEAP